jgi:hypothetical protein
MPLSGYSLLAAPLTLKALRERKVEIRELLAEVQSRHPRQALYFPFELGTRPIRPLQGYAFRLPRDFIFTFPELAVVGDIPPAPNTLRPELDGNRPGQGYRDLQEVRRVIELHAMQAATAYFSALGYAVEDVSRARPYDLLAVRGVTSLTVEVKGTTSRGDSVLLTRNEVNHARDNATHAVLFVLHSISLRLEEDEVSAVGGLPLVFQPWDVNTGTLESLQFKYVLPKNTPL